jgi:hypothetical protein
MRYALIICLFASNLAIGECDWSKITKDKDGNYIYTPELNRCVGALVEKEKLYQEQVEKLNKTIELKDLAITKTEQRVKLWQDTTYQLEEKYTKQNKYNDYRDWIFFGLGIVATGFISYTINKTK